MVKSLHLAKTYDELMQMSEVKLPNLLTLPRCLDKMKKMHDNAKQASLEKDQELEFMYLHRYLSLLNKATKIKEFTKEKYLNEFSCAQNNYKKYEHLVDTLKKRYEENKFKEKNDQNKKLSMKPISSPTHEKTLKDLTNHKTAGKISKNCIYSEELFALLDSKNNNKESYLIIDVRSVLDFKESHINLPNIINIPEERITPGMSAAALSKILPQDVKEQWDKRASVNKLIILDWSSSDHNVKKESKLSYLREAMTKWDPITKYRCPPLILEEGYEDFLGKYPHMTTNPKVTPPHPSVSIALSLDSFDYPMQILEPEEEKKVIPPKPEKIVPEGKTLAIDRSTKPILKEETEEKVIDEIIESEKKSDEVIADEESTESSPYSSPSLEEAEPTKIIEKENQKPNEELSAPDVVQDPKQILEELRKVKPDIPLRPQSTETVKGGDEDSLQTLKTEKSLSSTHRSPPEKRSAEGTHRIPLKKDDGSSSGILKRSSSSPNIAKMDDDGSMRVPSFTRSNKPVVYAERTDSTYGKTAAGLTGLKNFANNCYMNSILQCLSNTDSLVKELISINRSLVINPQSKTKGRVAQEVISAFRNMWSGDVRVYSIKDLKNLLGSLKEIFKGTGHQDSNEFLIILLEYLHDDLNIPANVESRLDGAKEETGEKAWGEFRRKNCSIIQRLFYGQHRSTVTCSSCGHSSVTFEQFFNLFVPIPSKDAAVTLNDCIQLYMSGEKISGWKCPKCKEERNATKKFDISRLPPVLVIALKRFTHEEDSWLQKKENLVTYPLESLDMERFTVKGSEQRYTKYNLYAMSTHTGTLRAGHYKAICKNHITEKWYMFDDQSVDPLPLHNVRSNPEVYILFYNAIVNC